MDDSLKYQIRIYLNHDCSNLIRTGKQNDILILLEIVLKKK